MPIDAVSWLKLGSHFEYQRMYSYTRCTNLYPIFNLKNYIMATMQLKNIFYRKKLRMNIQKHTCGGTSGALVAYSIALKLPYCTVSAVNDLEMVDCTHGHTFLSSCDLFLGRKKTVWLECLQNKISSI